MFYFNLLFNFIFVLIVQSKILEKEKVSTLRFVTVLWRHGDRTPTSIFPSDKENTLDKIKKKFGGLGQLTELGALQQFKLGRLLRERYDGFLSEEYSHEEFAYRSSYYNRTKMSILANAQGMFSSVGQNVPKLPLTENVPKDGITLKYLSKGTDPIVFDEVDCPVAKNEDDQVFESKEFKEIEQSNRPFLQFISENTDLINSEGILPLRNIFKVHDPLIFIESHQTDGFEFPEWANETIRNEIFRLYNLKNSFDFKTVKQKRLLAGPLFTEILNRMENIALEIGGKQKFQAYSGHDGTVAGLLSILGINLEIFPTFSTAVLIELHQLPNNNESSEENLIIRIFHKNETNGNCLNEIEIPNCGLLNCNLKQLKETRKEVVIEIKEWENECKNNDNYIFNNNLENI